MVTLNDVLFIIQTLSTEDKLKDFIFNNLTSAELFKMYKNLVKINFDFIKEYFRNGLRNMCINLFNCSRNYCRN